MAGKPAKLAPLTFGIYISHIPLLRVDEQILIRVDLLARLLTDPSSFIFAVIGGTALTWIVVS